MNFKELKEWLQDKDITEIALQTGIPRDRIYKWKNTTTNPKEKDYETLMEYRKKIQEKSSDYDLDTPINTLVTDEGNLYELLQQIEDSYKKPESFSDMFLKFIGFIPKEKRTKEMEDVIDNMIKQVVLFNEASRQLYEISMLLKKKKEQ